MNFILKFPKTRALIYGCYSAFRAAVRRVKIELPAGQISHVLHHTFASHFMMNGGNILVLQRILGHTDIKMTMRYSHFAPDHLNDVVMFNPLVRLKMNLVIYIIICLCIGIWICVQRDKFMLNSDSLHKQWLFRLAIAFPLVSSVYFIAWLGAPYPFRWDAYGYSTFLEINKFSLGILALSPILGAFVVSAHRSIQTTKQIEVTEKKQS